MAEDMGFEVLHGIVDCLWVVGEPISAFKEAVERETGILTEVDTYDWITFLPMSDGGGAYNRYFGRLNNGKMKIRGVMARKGDTPEYVNKMQQEVFEVLAGAKSLEDLRRIEPKARKVYRRYLGSGRCRCKGSGYSPQGQQAELFEEMYGGLGCAGLH
jgi:DNA polymerase I